MDEINAAIKGITSTHECDDAQLVVDKVNDFFGDKSLADMAAAKVCTFLQGDPIGKKLTWADVDLEAPSCFIHATVSSA